jgi:hypothetical protein
VGLELESERRRGRVLVLSRRTGGDPWKERVGRETNLQVLHMGPVAALSWPAPSHFLRSSAGVRAAAAHGLPPGACGL